MISNPIFKLDTKGRLRSWQYEVSGHSFRTHAGLVDGQKVTSGWTVCTPKSQATGAEQALFEAQAEERKKLEREYHRTPEECSTPNFFKPMLAHGWDQFKSNWPVATQPKLDGIRCIATVEGLFSRQGKPIVSCPHIELALQPIFAMDPDLVIDGELYNHDLKADFEKITSLVRKQKPIAETEGVVEYHVYDIASTDGPFAARIYRAHKTLELVRHIQLVETHTVRNQEELDEHYQRFLEQGYEGQMIRSLTGNYEQKRSLNLLKRKEFEDAEYPISRIIEGIGNWAGYAKAVEFILPNDLRLEDGSRPKAGIRGSREFTRKLLAEAADWENGGTTTIRFQNLSTRGIPRFPVAVAFHEGERL